MPVLLDFSRHADLSLHAGLIGGVVLAAAPLGVTPLITGAFARDLHLWYAHGIPIHRETEDVDVALNLPDWGAFRAVTDSLVASGNYKRSLTAAHRLRHGNGMAIDLVPFGTLETAGRNISWPPDDEIVMNVFGYREALANADEVILPENIRGRLVSLPALALLKFVCWHDRHVRFPGRDADDLQLILGNYLKAGNEGRLWSEFIDWTQEDDFDYETAGPRMIGYDWRGLLEAGDIDRIAIQLSEQTEVEDAGLLAVEMNRNNPDRARRWLGAVLTGLVQPG